MKQIKLETTIKEAQQGGTFTGIANTFKQTLNGNTYTREAFREAIGKTVPLLLSHDWGALPVGTAKFENIGDDGVTYTGRIFENVENRALLLEQLGSGTVGVSIGGIANKEDTNGQVTAMDLLELSLTAIPADKGATAILESVKLTEANDELTSDDNPKDDTQGDEKTTEVTNAQLMEAIGALQTVANNILKAVQTQQDEDDKDDKPKPDDNKHLAEALSLINRVDLKSVEAIKLYNRLKGML